MKEYKRDKKTGMLVFYNPEKEREIMRNRSITQEIKTLREEINILKAQVNELLAKRN